jgi:hypothetical protein
VDIPNAIFCHGWNAGATGSAWRPEGKELNNRLLFAVLVMQFVSTIVFKSHLSVFRNF